MPRVKQEEEELQPETKKAKISTTSMKKEEEGDDHENDAEEDNETETGSVVKRNADGEAYVELGTKKRCTVRKWNNNVLVDIREVRVLPYFVSHGTITIFLITQKIVLRKGWQDITRKEGNKSNLGTI